MRLENGNWSRIEDAVPVDVSWIGFDCPTHLVTYLHGSKLRYSGGGKAMKSELDFAGGVKRQFNAESKKTYKKGTAYVAACDEIMMEEFSPDMKFEVDGWSRISAIAMHQ